MSDKIIPVVKADEPEEEEDLVDPQETLRVKLFIFVQISSGAFNLIF